MQKHTAFQITASKGRRRSFHTHTPYKAQGHMHCHCSKLESSQGNRNTSLVIQAGCNPGPHILRLLPFNHTTFHIDSTAFPAWRGKQTNKQKTEYICMNATFDFPSPTQNPVDLLRKARSGQLLLPLCQGIWCNSYAHREASRSRADEL